MMRFVTRQHVARLVAARSGRCINLSPRLSSPSCMTTTISNSRPFTTKSDSDEEIDALFRALKSKKDPVSVQEASSSGNTLRQKSNRQNTSRKDDSFQRTKKSSPPKRQRKKAQTLDDFFANMGVTERKHQQRLPPRENQTSSRQQGLADSLAPLSSQSGSSESKRQPMPHDSSQEKPQLSSFFDQVDALVKERAEKEGTNTSSESSLRQSSDNNRSPQHYAITGNDGGPRKSIFDVVAEATSSQTADRSPNAYDEDSYDEYLDLLEPILESPKFLLQKKKAKRVEDADAVSIIEWLKAEEPVVPCSLPILEQVLKDGLSPEDEASASTQFQEELLNQRASLVEHYGWNQNQLDAAIGALTQLGAQCAKNASAAPLDIAWQKLKEAGHLKQQKSLANYLYVSSSFSVQPMTIPLSSSSPSNGESILDFLYEADNKGNNEATIIVDNSESSGADDDEASSVEEPVDLACEIAVCHDLLFGPSEQSTSMRVRTLVSQGKPQQAEQLLKHHPSGDDLRLRAYTPVFQFYLSQGDVRAAFHLFAKMSRGKNVQIQPENYVQLIAGAAENGYFRHDSDPIEGIKELGYSSDSGPELFNLLASEMADATVEIPAASAKRLYSALQSGFEGHSAGCNLERLHIFHAMNPCNDAADSNELIASRVSLDPNTGNCPRSGAHLRLINLDIEQRQQLQNGLLYLSATSYEARHKEYQAQNKIVDARNKAKNSKAEDELRRFGEWLQNRDGEPFTAIIDGPNVAYYMQNFEQGTFNFHQIKFVVDALEDMGENVLVTMPEKYTRNSFTLYDGLVSQRRKQVLSASDKRVREELVSSGKVYVVPKGCLDDYYWMFASVSSQQQHQTGAHEKEMYIPPGNPEGRWPGIRPMLISNDKMRDHKLSLLEPRLFRRWYSNYMVNFTFSAFVGDQCTDREIGFSTADFYSREIQGNPTTDDNGQDCGTAWHFPVSDWDENESFCIRIPKAI